MFLTLLLVLHVLHVFTVTASPSSVTFRLNDSNSDTLFYLCSFGSTEVPSQVSSSKFILIDVRDLPSNHSGIVHTAEARIENVRKNFPKAQNTTAKLILLMLEDKTGIYKLADLLEINMVLAVTDNITVDVAEPVSAFVGRVFFVQSDAIMKLDKHLQSNSASGLILDIVETASIGVGYGILAFLILKVLSLSSIIIAGLIVLKNNEDLLEMVHKIRSDASGHPFMRAIIPILFLVCSISIILLAYFFYDVIVYFFIALFVITGASSMSFLTSTVLFMKAPALKRLNFRVFKVDINFVRSILFFLYLPFTVTWCIFRNNSSVGWIMQDIIGVFIIIEILTDFSVLVSFKLICAGFFVFVAYDVFFVFLTPFFGKNQSNASITLPSNSHEILTRNRRSIASPGESIMEAVATGSAGSSGELMPLVFKVSMHIFANEINLCHNSRDYVLLGFGDAILPGVLCVLLAFYDACWKRRVPWNFLSSLLGYALGGLVAAGVLFGTKLAQPALLYLCPLTLGTTVLCAYLRGGCAELHGLWSTNLPALITTSRVLDEDTMRSDERAIYLTSSTLPDPQTNAPIDVWKKGAFHRDRFANA